MVILQFNGLQKWLHMAIYVSQLACHEGTYGRHCKGRCKCSNGGRCDTITGTCECLPGFLGANCSIGESVSMPQGSIPNKHCVIQVTIFNLIAFMVCMCVSQLVLLGAMGRTVAWFVFVGMENSATQWLENVPVLQAGQDDIASMVLKKNRTL